MATSTKRINSVASVECVCDGNNGASVSVCVPSAFNSFHCVFFARSL